MAGKNSNVLAALLAVMALLLVVSGVGLLWVAWRGVEALKLEARPHPHPAAVTDADVTPDVAPVESTEEEESVPVAVDAGSSSCPFQLHPSYCTRRCRSYDERARTMHARRIYNPLRSGVGGGGPYKVFVEEQRGEDGGAAGGIVEYYDGTTNQLVGADDSRGTAECHTYGTIPKCTPEIKWEPPRADPSGSLK